MIRVGLCGAAGRMGREIIKQIANQADMEIAAAVEAPNSSSLGKDAGEIAGVGPLGVEVQSAENLREVLEKKKVDVLVDFTRAEAAVENIRVAAGLGIPVVVGTTGFSAEQKAEVERIVRENGISAVISPNMSVGVNVFFKLVAETARMLGPEYEAEIVEIHHRGKLDAPSGTALKAAKLIASALGLKEDAIKTGRPAGKHEKHGREIYIHSIRAGDVAGEHTVVFAGPAERIELTHRAHHRETFAAGVVRAVRFLKERHDQKKIYDMWDVLGIQL